MSTAKILLVDCHVVSSFSSCSKKEINLYCQATAIDIALGYIINLYHPLHFKQIFFAKNSFNMLVKLCANTKVRVYTTMGNMAGWEN